MAEFGMKKKMISRATAVLGGLLCLIAPRVDHAAVPLPFIQTRGTEFVDESGKRVILKGCNLGNWLIIELWMFGGCIQTSDQAHLFAKLDERFGAGRAKQLMDVYRSSWITQRDFDQLKSFGFNAVRLPIDYRLLQSDQAPYEIKPDGFKWIDRAVDFAQNAGIYIILDLHSAPGGQSTDQCTGQSGQNKLWNNPMNQKREVDIWRAIATRYRERSNVAGYDLMNEPYADHKMDVRSELRKMMTDCYTAIRATGDKHVMFFPGALGSFPSFYDDPHVAGWSNVGFTEHFYPGLFGDKVAFEGHIRTLTQAVPTRQKWLDTVQSPYYIGEFNPVLDATGGTNVTRAYFDAFARQGWAGTLWSYKLVKPKGGATSNTWYCVSNADPLPKLKLDSSSYEEFENFFSSFAAIPMAVNQPLHDALTRTIPIALPLDPQDAMQSAPQADGPSLLKNGSFDEAGSRPDVADYWQCEGDGFHRETGRTPMHTGTAEMEYQQTASANSSQIWQDIPAQAGRRYRLSVSVLCDDSKDAKDVNKIELRLEGTLDGHAVTLNSMMVKGSEITAGDKWTQLSVDGTALGNSIRAKIIATPATNAPRGGAVKFDDATLQLLSDGK